MIPSREEALSKLNEATLRSHVGNSALRYAQVRELLTASKRAEEELGRISGVLCEQSIKGLLAMGADNPSDARLPMTAAFLNGMNRDVGMGKKDGVNEGFLYEGFWRADMDVLTDHSPRDLRRKLDTVLSEVERGDDLDMKALDSLIASLQAIKKAARQFSSRAEAEEAGFVGE